MSDHSRTYRILLDPDASLKPETLRHFARTQLKNGARPWDFLEIKQGQQIVSFRKIGDILPPAIETVRESAE